MAGKGSKARPLSIKYEEYADNFDSIFRKPKPEKEKPTVREEKK